MVVDGVLVQYRAVIKRRGKGLFKSLLPIYVTANIVRNIRRRESSVSGDRQERVERPVRLVARVNSIGVAGMQRIPSPKPIRSRFTARLGIVGAAVFALVSSSLVMGPAAYGVDPCNPVVNPIVCENSKPGTPDTEWDIQGAGDPTIQGFATDISVNVGADGQLQDQRAPTLSLSRSTGSATTTATVRAWSGRPRRSHGVSQQPAVVCGRCLWNTDLRLWYVGSLRLVGQCRPARSPVSTSPS